MGANKDKNSKKAQMEEEQVIQDEEWGIWSKFAFYLWAFLLRLAFIWMGKIIDNSRSPNVYTNKEYEVMTNAAGHLLGGGSPYATTSFKSSPLAAFLCIPNHLFSPESAKVLYALTDILIGWFIWKIVES
jgi:phosphatidylinositol glycan class M